MWWTWFLVASAGAASPCDDISVTAAVGDAVASASAYDTTPARSAIMQIEANVTCLDAVDTIGLVRLYQWAAIAAVTEASSKKDAAAVERLRQEARKWLEQAARFDAGADLPRAAGDETSALWAEAKRTVAQAAKGTIRTRSPITLDGRALATGEQTQVAAGWHVIQGFGAGGVVSERVNVTQSTDGKVRLVGKPSGARIGATVAGATLVVTGAAMFTLRMVYDQEKALSTSPYFPGDEPGYLAASSAVTAVGAVALGVGVGALVFGGVYEPGAQAVKLVVKGDL